MGEPIPSNTPPERPLEERLDSWKEIAAYLNRDVTTVQRWEKKEGMPVHRHLHDKMGSVFAFRTDLDAWVRTRNLRGQQDNGSHTASPDSLVSPPVPAIAAALKRWGVVLISAAVLAAAALGVSLWLQRTEYFWRNPLANARFQTVTDFDAGAQAAAISRDGHFIAFLSDRDGRMDVWVTQVGSGQFHNLTHGSAPELVNPSVRTLGFSPDGSVVTFWVRKQSVSGSGEIGVWAVPTLGGEPKPYLDGVAEFDWSRDTSRLAYHTPGPGDPLFVSSSTNQSDGHLIFTAPAGLHSHFPLWGPDSSLIYFVEGSLPDKMDIWRIGPTGGNAERITWHNARVSYPVLLDRRTLGYLATDSDASGPWIYGEDVDRRIPHRLISGLDRYTSLAATEDGQRLVATVATPKRTLWRLPIATSSADAPAAARISLATGTGFAPRFGPDFLLYVSGNDTNSSIWKIVHGTGAELWSGRDAQISGGPAVSLDGQWIAFSVRQNGKALLYAMRSDGTNAHIVADSLNLQGSPAWSSDGKFITAAAEDRGVPHLYRFPIEGGPSGLFLSDYSLDPVWSPDGRFVIYSGPDIGTNFLVKAATSDAVQYALPALTLTRGARHLSFLPGGRSLVFLRGDIQHKNLWAIDLTSGAERQLTNFAPDFEVRDFDISPDGQEVVVEREQELSEVVILDLPRK